MTTLDINKEQLQKMKTHPGFIAALDQSGGSTPKALGSYGIKENAWSNDDEMLAIVHRMRSRIMTSPSFNGERILAAILFERTMDSNVEGQPTTDYLWKVNGAFSESRQGPSRREGRGSVDEAHARACCAPRQSQSEGHFRNQDALGHQARQPGQH